MRAKIGYLARQNDDGLPGGGVAPVLGQGLREFWHVRDSVRVRKRVVELKQPQETPKTPEDTAKTRVCYTSCSPAIVTSIRAFSRFSGVTDTRSYLAESGARSLVIVATENVAGLSTNGARCRPLPATVIVSSYRFDHDVFRHASGEGPGRPTGTSRCRCSSRTAITRWDDVGSPVRDAKHVVDRSTAPLYPGPRGLHRGIDSGGWHTLGATPLRTRPPCPAGPQHERGTDEAQLNAAGERCSRASGGAAGWPGKTYWDAFGRFVAS
jgi:hypothetical protein